MVKRDYPMVIQPLSEEDGGGFLAYAPDLPGCMGDGETADEAAVDLQKAIGEWIDEAVRLNRDVPNPGDFVQCFRQGQQKVKELLAAQDKLIKQQEGVIRQQTQGLNEAKQEIEAIKAGILHLLVREDGGDRPYLSLAAGLDVQIQASAHRKPQFAH